MSAAVAYDTLKIARQLTQPGLEPKVAEGVSETFANILADREDSLATKGDLTRTETSLKSGLARLDGRLESLRVELRHELRGEIKQANIEQIRWLIGAMIAIAGLLFAGIKLL